MIKMYSPLRYPGGKNKIYDKMVKFMGEHNLYKYTYVEPYAGGFGVGVRLLFENKVESVIYNDSDKHLYNLWYSILNYTEELCDMLEHVEITIAERNNQKKIYCDQNATQLQDGFATLFLNRVNFSGVIKGGPIGGYSQNGKYLLGCRFRRNDLIQVIKKIASYKEKIVLYNMDAVELMKSLLENSENYFLNIDPPYVKKGHLLYTVHYKTDHDHRTLSEFMHTIKTSFPWIITYDKANLISDLYSDCNLKEFYLVHNAGGSKKGEEIVISNLSLDGW